MSVKPSQRRMTRILLAEDDDAMRGFLSRALDRAGHDVVALSDGQEAYERLQAEPFDLLLTDIVMPVMDGIELARRASEIDPRMKIMFITGFAAVTLESDPAALDETRVLSKPFHLRELVDAVERLLEEG
ncbi:MAG: response regulator [Pseudomonadota bacterium]